MFADIGAAFRSQIGWKGIGALVSVVIASVALFALFKVFRNVHSDQVIDALAQTSAPQLGAAFLLVVGSYLSLTAYDLLAVRTLGLGTVNYRTAALASFVSYPIAHATGAVLPVSAAIRYRIYSASDVGAADVARICMLTGLTFWLGNLAMLGLSGCCVPLSFGLFADLPSGVSRALAIALLITIAG